MKKFLLYFTLICLITSCSKSKFIENNINNLQPEYGATNSVSGTNSIIIDPDDEAAKKYAQKICYVNGDPYSLGTNCEDPGKTCKKYDCTLSTAAGNRVLSFEEIEECAREDVNILLKKGLIDEKKLKEIEKFYLKIIFEKNEFTKKSK